MSEPFATAPRDGRLFWAWHAYDQKWYLMRRTDDGWWLVQGINDRFPPWKTTFADGVFSHWEPLDPPAAP